MLLDRIFLLVVVLALVVPLYWSIPPRLFALRQALLIACSLAALWLIGLFLPLMPLALFGCVSIFAVLARAGVATTMLRRASWLIFVPLFLHDLIRIRLGIGTVPVAGMGFDLFGLGFGFAVLRAFLCIREMLLERRFDPGATLLALCFFPTYLTGPIAGAAYYGRASCAERLSGVTAFHAFCRIGLGAGLFLVARPAVLDWNSGLDPASVAGAWTGVLQRFVALYLDFSGYTEVAIGAGALFGFALPENFRAPLLSRSIQDFWRRWHLSLARLIGTYLAKPMTRRTGRPHLAIVAAFVLVGLWHAVTPNYLFWGLAHGVALVVHDRMREPVARLPLPPALVGVLGWAMTIAYVAMLSAISNAPDAAAGIDLARRLVGWT